MNDISYTQDLVKYLASSGLAPLEASDIELLGSFDGMMSPLQQSIAEKRMMIEINQAQLSVLTSYAKHSTFRRVHLYLVEEIEARENSIFCLSHELDEVQQELHKIEAHTLRYMQLIAIERDCTFCPACKSFHPRGSANQQPRTPELTLDPGRTIIIPALLRPIGGKSRFLKYMTPQSKYADSAVHMTGAAGEHVAGSAVFSDSAIIFTDEEDSGNEADNSDIGPLFADYDDDDEDTVYRESEPEPDLTMNINHHPPLASTVPNSPH